MKRWAWTLSLAIGLVALGAYQARSETVSNPLATRTEKLIKIFMTSAGEATPVPGSAMSVAIGRDGTLLYADGFGDAGPNRPASGRTLYMVGSLTKQFTAAAILRLVEEGARIGGSGEKLKVTTPVADVLGVGTDWQIEGGPPITISHLLSMTSNLPNYTRRPPHELDPWGAVPARRLLTGIKEFRPSGYPGAFEYSNTSYFLLSEIMEDVEVGGSVRSYHQILKDEIFSRLGMSDTGFRDNPHIAKNLALPHYQRRPRFFQPDWLKGSGDVASSVIDVFKWNKALMQGEALCPDMRKIMLADNGRVDVWTYYGAGWFITHKDGVDRYFHSGTVSGYTSFNLIVRPSEAQWVSVSLLTNSDGVEHIDALADQIAELALER